jgi:glutamyl-tRNA reductase
MSFLVTGLNHNTAPVDIREQVAMTGEVLPEALQELSLQPGVNEAMIVSTCNRVELVVSYGQRQPNLVEFFSKRFPACAAELPAHLYHHHETEAVRHLFRVASSLDSMVVGEPQILGQVKDAFAVAREVGTARSELDRLLRSTFTAAKRVRSETAIGSSSVSIASVAVDLASKIFGSLSATRVLLIGAGKMGELAARHLLSQGAGSLTITNRTEERARALADAFGCSVLPFSRLRDEAHRFDIVITSTGSREVLFSRDDARQIIARRRRLPMFVIDIAVPRDIDPEANSVEGFFLYDVDDLQSVAAANLADRAREVAKAEAVVGAEVERFARSASVLGVVPTIRALQESVEAMRQSELQRSASKLAKLTPAQREAVEALTRGLTNKFLHGPLQALKAAAAEDDHYRLETLREVFQLPDLPVQEEKKGAKKKKSEPRLVAANLALCRP